MSGDIRIGLQPGFGGLMQDLGRHAIGDIVKKVETPAVQQPPVMTAGETPAASFLPAVITLSAPLPLQAATADRRLLSLAEFQQAFVDFDEPPEPRLLAHPRKAQEVGRSKAAPASTEAPPDSPAPQRHATPLGLETQPLKAGSKLLPGQTPAAPPRHTLASTGHVAGPPGAGVAGPASGQPTLFIFAVLIAALMGGWLATRLM